MPLMKVDSTNGNALEIDLDDREAIRTFKFHVRSLTSLRESSESMEFPIRINGDDYKITFLRSPDTAFKIEALSKAADVGSKLVEAIEGMLTSAGILVPNAFRRNTVQELRVSGESGKKISSDYQVGATVPVKG